MAKKPKLKCDVCGNIGEWNLSWRWKGDMTTRNVPSKTTRPSLKNLQRCEYENKPEALITCCSACHKKADECLSRNLECGDEIDAIVKAKKELSERCGQ